MYGLSLTPYLPMIVNGKADKQDKPDEDESGDEAEEATGTTSIFSLSLSLLHNSKNGA